MQTLTMQATDDALDEAEATREVTLFNLTPGGDAILGEACSVTDRIRNNDVSTISIAHTGSPDEGEARKFLAYLQGASNRTVTAPLTVGRSGNGWYGIITARVRL